jgi:hypothetical protein
LICRYRIPFWKISDSSCVVPDAAGISQGGFFKATGTGKKTEDLRKEIEPKILQGVSKM